MGRIFFVAIFSIYPAAIFATLPRCQDDTVKVRISNALHPFYATLLHNLLPNFKKIKREIEENRIITFNLWARTYPVKDESYTESDIKILEFIENFVNTNKMIEYCDKYNERVINYIKYYRERHGGKHPITVTLADLEGQ